MFLRFFFIELCLKSIKKKSNFSDISKNLYSKISIVFNHLGNFIFIEKIMMYDYYNEERLILIPPMCVIYSHNKYMRTCVILSPLVRSNKIVHIFAQS